jgi:hypothetical protein
MKTLRISSILMLFIAAACVHTVTPATPQKAVVRPKEATPQPSGITFLMMSESLQCGTVFQPPCGWKSKCEFNPDSGDDPCPLSQECGSSDLHLNMYAGRCIPKTWVYKSVNPGMREWDQAHGLPMDWEKLNNVTDLTADDNVGLPRDGLYIFIFRAGDSKLRIRLSDRPGDRGKYFMGNPSCSYEGNPPNPPAEEPHMFVRHTQLNGGWMDVWSAGQLEIYGGKIIWISNESGHFGPALESLEYVDSALVAVGLAQKGSIEHKDYGWTKKQGMVPQELPSPNNCEMTM